MPTLTPAVIEWTDQGHAYSPTYGDVYASSSGALEQAQHVFLRGNQLPERWRHRHRFTILETGFGLGINFAATLAAFAQDSVRPRALHYIATELHPVTRDDLQRALSTYPALALHTRELVAAWPHLTQGYHRLHLANGAVTLTLLFGDALSMLRTLDARVDAIYLDGFSPAKNAEMWSPLLIHEIARLAAASATLATWSVTAAVRTGLAESGFHVRKAAGFAAKREMLVGERTGTAAAESAPLPRSAIVIGGGLAGSCTAERLAARGTAVTVIDSQQPDTASALPVLLLRPILNATDNIRARLSRSAFGYALRHLQRVANTRRLDAWDTCGILQRAVHATDGELWQRILTEHDWPADVVQWVESNEARRRTGHADSRGGLWFADGAWIDPLALCKTNIVHAQRLANTRHVDAAVERITASESRWRVRCRDGAEHVADAVVVACGAATGDVLGYTLNAQITRGQLAVWPGASASRVPITGAGYCASHRGALVFGTGQDHYALDAVVDDISPRALGERWQQLMGATPLPSGPPTLHTGTRVIPRDKLPLAGLLPREHSPPLAVLAGLGTRGTLWAPIGAEIVACALHGEPCPLAHDDLAALQPARALR